MRILSLLFMAAVICSYQESRALAEPSKNTPVKKLRDYPGGRDEEDLKVRHDTPAPTAKINRRAIEEQVLKKMYQQAEKPVPKE